jgi:tryptophan synthase alpha chain
MSDNNQFDASAPRVMCHLVAGFPDSDRAFSVGKALVDAGAAFLEIQFPFSDPSADGPLIQTACVRSLQNGFKLKAGFEFIRRISAYAKTPIFIMSYACPVVAYGMEKFCAEAKRSGVSGLIIPDLTMDNDEGLYVIGAKAGLTVVPVIAPGTTPERMRRITQDAPEYVYAALRTGITGKQTEIGADNIDFLESVKAKGSKVLAGFGVKSRAQIKALSSHVHAAVIGSAFTEIVLANEEKDGEQIYQALYRYFESLKKD